MLYNRLLEDLLTKNLAKQKVTLISFFWRTYDQQELDLLELKNNQLQAFEIKSSKGRAKVPVAFSSAYPGASFNVINYDNYLEWIVNP